MLLPKVVASNVSKTSKRLKSSKVDLERADAWLSPVLLYERKPPVPMANQSGKRASDKGFLPLKSLDYISFVEWTGRQIKHGKAGLNPKDCKSILERPVFIDRVFIGKVCCDLVCDIGKLFKRAVGKPVSM